MSYCLVKICKNNKKKANKCIGDVSYHKFPKKSRIREQWIKAAGHSEGWAPSPSSVMCSQHFDNNCFLEKNGRRYLKGDSVPTLKLAERFCAQDGSEVKELVTSNFVNSCNLSGIVESLFSSDGENIVPKNDEGLNISLLMEEAQKELQQNAIMSTSVPDLIKIARQLEEEKKVYKELAESRRKSLKLKNATILKLTKQLASMQALVDTLQDAFNLGNDELNTIKQNINLE